MTKAKQIEEVLERATPRPWDWFACTVGLLGDPEQDTANAELIKLAVNSYEPMREALKAAVEALERCRKTLILEGYITDPIDDGFTLCNVEAALVRCREVLGQ